VENQDKIHALLSKFFAFSLPVVLTAGQLAKELALRTRFLRDEVIGVEMEQQQKGKGELYGFFETFKQYLISHLREKEFADLFSQTITYGLFAARTRSTNGFNRKLAYDLIPKTIGILRNVFKFISQGDLPTHMEVMVDDIANVLNAADVNTILRQYYQAGKGEDPIVHFYETFLSEYDPATREKRGVYYTPEPVVRFIVRSVHQILKTRFDLSDGLASREVTLLDPAGGTLTFPAEAIKLAVSEYIATYGEGGVKKLISEHILKDFYAFELMMAPYAIGHIKMNFLLEELGYSMKEDERFKLYLTNTLDMEDLAQTQIPGLENLSHESHEAGKVKKSDPILVIMGNPPYSANSANYNDWTEKLLKENLDGAQSFYQVDGGGLNERNPKLLQDDYVKFLRFAQWKIQKAGKGIVGMITNHGFLNNVTFRGMRQSLMNTFNEIHILDLHGDSQKKERPPDGGKDENVFDITKGTAITIFVKQSAAKGCKVFHQDLFGLRDEKYSWLDSHDYQDKAFQQVEPESPWYFFIKRDVKEIKQYDTWPQITEIFPVNSTGIKTHRDDFVIAFNASELENRLRQFKNPKFPDEFIKEAYSIKNTSTFSIEKTREKVNSDRELYEKITQISYRPFDTRFIIYSDDLIDRPRREVMQHMQTTNMALVCSRQTHGKFRHIFISNSIIDFNLTGTAGSYGSGYLIPLYLYKSPEPKRKKIGIQTMMLFEPEQEYVKSGKIPNIALTVFERLDKAYGKKPSPEQILYYCYAILYSNHYREKYAEFLKIDFPRIPFTSDYQLFLQLSELGEELAQLHLLKSKTLENPIVKYRGTGDDIIEKPRLDEAKHCVFINDTKYFDGISKEIWDYCVGGYQVLEKYLKDRKGRQMSDPAIYCKIATAIAKTIDLQGRIDLIFAPVEQHVVEFH